MRQSGLFFSASVAGFALLLSPACSDEGEDDVGTGGSATTGTTTTGTPTSSTTGGSTGSTMQGGGGAGGGEGGGNGCLPASATADYFTIDDPTLCAVGTYTAPGLPLDSYGTTPSWGFHGGPLTIVGTDTMLTIRRWTVPTDGTELTFADTTVPVTVDAGAFWGPQAIDFAPGVAVATWSAPFPSPGGGLIRIEDSAVVQADVTGVFGIGASQGRLLYSGLSEVGTSMAGTNALYGAAVTPSAITTDGMIDDWGTASGPIAVDEQGYVFAGMTDFGSGDQELRGFDVDDVQPKNPPVVGVTLATLPGYGDAMAAIVASGQNPGLLLFQGNDATTSAHLDVIGIPYAIENGVVVSAGQPTTVLTLADADKNLTLMTDDSGRIWVGATSETTPTDGVFFVLDRIP